MTLFSPFSDRNLILTGYVSPDQRSLGRQIAEKLRMPFVDIETEIANRVNLSIEEIRAYYGETRLKAIEAEIIHEASLRRSAVIRISGYTLRRSDYLARLQATGPVVYLAIELGAMLRRLHTSMGARYHDPQERAVALAELRREWAAQGLSGLHEIDTTYMTREEIIAEVVTFWQKVALRRG